MKPKGRTHKYVITFALHSSVCHCLAVRSMGNKFQKIGVIKKVFFLINLILCYGCLLSTMIAILAAIFDGGQVIRQKTQVVVQLHSLARGLEEQGTIRSNFFSC